MARFYPTTVIVVLVILVLVFFTIPKLMTEQPEKLSLQENAIQLKIEDKGSVDKVELIISDEKIEMVDTAKKSKEVQEDEAPRKIIDEAKDVAEDKSSSSSDTEEGETDTENSLIKVMITSDNKTLGGLVATMNSIYMNTASRVRFYLLVDKVSVPHLREWITKTSLKDIDYVLKAFNDSLVKNKIKVRDARQDLGSPLNFARFYFPLVFPSIDDRLIFIDADSIVQGDIQELWDMQLQKGHAAAFSDDCTSISHRSNLIQNKYMDYLNFKNPTIKSLNLNPMTCSFNTGVYVIDVREWKRQRITKQLDHWLSLNANEELYGSQRGGGNSGPPFFIVFYNKYTQLSPAWNVRYLGVTPGTRYSDPFVKSAKLLHWNGPFKPWGRTAQHTDDWDKYYLSDPTGKFKVVRKYKTI